MFILLMVCIRKKIKNVKPITNQLLLSLKEQIILIIVGIISMILIASNVFNNCNYCEYIKFGLETLLVAVFINSVQVLWDTGKSVFVLIDFMIESDDE